MKTLGLSPHPLVATLFLVVGLTETRAQNDAPSPAAAERAATAARPEEDRANLERVLRATVTADPSQLRRFDLNPDGKLDDHEWLGAKKVIQRAFAPVALPSGFDEARSFDAVAAEVARRRALRVQAEKTTAWVAVAAEVARRRALREPEKLTGVARPETDAEREPETRMLGNDLLEIGMAQRRAHEAKTKAGAEAEPKK